MGMSLRPLSLIRGYDLLIFDSGISGSPSRLQLFRLAANKEFRTAVQSLMIELENAEVDLSSEVRVVLCRVQRRTNAASLGRRPCRR
jgi:hypothetical protein